MFNDRSIDCEQSPEIDAAACTAISVQPIRLSPIQGGAWHLPAIHPDVPQVLQLGDGVTEQILATLALEGHACGMRLPGGTFTTTTKSLQNQLKKFIASQCSKDSPLSMVLDITASPTHITLSIQPSGILNFLRMKNTVEKLNIEHAGLGWWVMEVANAASRDYYPIYRLSEIADFLEYNSPMDGKFSDQGLIKGYNANNGTRQTRAQIEKDYQMFWPSDLIRAVDGHAWMLGRMTYNYKNKTTKPLQKRPQTATVDEAKKFVTSGAQKELTKIVEDFLALKLELDRQASSMRNASRPAGCEYEDVDALGAACALVWDDHEMAFNLIQHNEQSLMEHGEYVDTHIEYQIEAMDQAGVHGFIQFIKDFVIRHSAISKAFSHFERCQ